MDHLRHLFRDRIAVILQANSALRPCYHPRVQPLFVQNVCSAAQPKAILVEDSFEALRCCSFFTSCLWSLGLHDLFPRYYRKRGMGRSIAQNSCTPANSSAQARSVANGAFDSQPRAMTAIRIVCTPSSAQHSNRFSVTKSTSRTG